MIAVRVNKTADGAVYAFKVKNHGEPIVCAAVSVLVINCVNSIERFTDTRIICKHNSKGGYISAELPDIKNGIDNEETAKARLLLQSMLLGLAGIAGEYPGSIKIKEVKQ